MVQLQNEYNKAMTCRNSLKLIFQAHPLHGVRVRGLRKEWISIPPPPEGNCRGAAHAFSLCSAPCSHANGDKPTVFGLLPPLELLLPHQAEAYLSTLSWIPFGCRKTSGLHIKAHHNSVVLPQVSLGGSVT